MGLSRVRGRERPQRSVKSPGLPYEVPPRLVGDGTVSRSYPFHPSDPEVLDRPLSPWAKRCQNWTNLREDGRRRPSFDFVGRFSVRQTGV